MATPPINVSVAGQQVPLFIQPNSNYHDLALLPDGRILVAGTAIVPNLGEYVGLAMFLPNGTLDPSFNGTGTLFVGSDPIDGFQPYQAVNLAVENNQILLLAGGQFVNPQVNSASRLYEFHLDGTRNASFGSSGEISPPANNVNFAGMTVQPDGDIILSYHVSLSEFVSRYSPERLARPHVRHRWPGDLGESSNAVWQQHRAAAGWQDPDHGRHGLVARPQC